MESILYIIELIILIIFEWIELYSFEELAHSLSELQLKQTESEMKVLHRRWYCIFWLWIRFDRIYIVYDRISHLNCFQVNWIRFSLSLSFHRYWLFKSDLIIVSTRDCMKKRRISYKGFHCYVLFHFDGTQSEGRRGRRWCGRQDLSPLGIFETRNPSGLCPNGVWQLCRQIASQ
jgi:hypothetical protein